MAWRAAGGSGWRNSPGMAAKWLKWRNGMRHGNSSEAAAGDISGVMAKAGANA